VFHGSPAPTTSGWPFCEKRRTREIGSTAVTDRSQELINEIRETPGEWLYHYTTLETALVYILPTRQLRLSPFSKMRDPREAKEWFPAAVGYGDVPEDVLLQGIAASSAQANLLRDEFKLLSLTTDRDDNAEGKYGRGFAKSRLWETYANRGTGVCLVLRKDTAVSSIPPRLARLGRQAHGPVVYRNTPIHTEVMFHFEDVLSGEVNAAAERIAENHLEKLFLTKNTEWASESEYRFVVRSKAAFEFVDVSDSLVAVCRGPSSAREAEHALRHFANELDLALGFVQWDHNDPILLGRPLR
jgi:hypothetical protein